MYSANTLFDLYEQYLEKGNFQNQMNPKCRYPIAMGGFITYTSSGWLEHATIGYYVVFIHLNWQATWVYVIL